MTTKKQKKRATIKTEISRDAHAVLEAGLGKEGRTLAEVLDNKLGI